MSLSQAVSLSFARLLACFLFACLSFFFPLTIFPELAAFSEVDQGVESVPSQPHDLRMGKVDCSGEDGSAVTIRKENGVLSRRNQGSQPAVWGGGEGKERHQRNPEEGGNT